VSLTSHLADPTSPVRGFIEERVPIIGFSKRGELLAEGWAKILGINELPRTPVRPPKASVADRRFVGTALDYRIRYYFGSSDSAHLVARHGAALLSSKPMREFRGALKLEPGEVYSDEPPPKEAKNVAQLVPEFFTSLDSVLARINPVRRRLTQKDEEELARYCLALAHFEAFYRAGVQINSPFYELKKNATLFDLLEVPPHECVEDLCALSWDFEMSANHLFIMPAELNPTFEGSIDVGGADADMVLGDHLFEIKTMTTPRPQDLRYAITQLLGYTLLDYRDRFGIRNLSICFTRQDKIWSSPLWHFLVPPATLVQFLTDGQRPSEREIDESLKRLRSDFRDIL